MSDQQLEQFGLRVQALAATLPYPPTPNVAARLKARSRTSPDVRRRLTFAALASVLACIASLAVPQVRATLIEFFQIGAVRIFLTEPTPTTTPTGTPTIVPTPTLLPSLLNLSGKTTLTEARAQTGFDLPLPTYPADLGEPDQVFVQDLEGYLVIMVWLDPSQPNRVELSLHIIAPESFAIKKAAPEIIQFTQVNNHDAIWAEGPYLLELANGNYDIRRLIEGHVLIWTVDDLTYRLETDVSMEEAIQIAESLK